MASMISLCQHYQCDAYQFTICRHCQLFLCIKHLAEHQQQFPSDFQRLLDDARKQQAQLATNETKNVRFDRQINLFDDDDCLFETFNEDLNGSQLTNLDQITEDTDNNNNNNNNNGFHENDVNPIHNSLTVRELKTYKCDYCPLATNNYGIESHHQVRHIPCIRRSTSQISLFEHLKQYHYLNYAASMQIVRLVSSGDLDDHPHLFSSSPQSSIVSILPSFFRAPCPLTQHYVFGLTPMHGIRLCTPATDQQDFALYDHFLAYHQLNRASAMKLVKAMMRNENSNQRVLFRPDEQVLNETAYVLCPLSSYERLSSHQEHIPHTPCQSTVKLRYLTGHLRDVHHLNKIAAKRIATALRHEQANNQRRSMGLVERDENILKSKKKKNSNRFRPPVQLTEPISTSNPPSSASPSIW